MLTAASGAWISMSAFASVTEEGANLVCPGADTLLSESQVVKTWPCLSRIGLRAARKSGKIRWVRGQRGTAWYEPSAVREYIRDVLEVARWLDHDPDPCSNSAVNGSPPKAIEEICTAIGSTLELEEHVAKVCAQRILNPPNGPLQKSSSKAHQRRRPPGSL